MTFADARWLWGLLAIPILLLIEWRAARRGEQRLRSLVGARGERVLLAQRLPGARRLSLALRALALAALVLGASGPEWGREVVRRPATGSDVLFVIDVSASMDARDVPPSRLDEARREALALLERLSGSRVGVLAFAGDAVRLCPLTLDLGAARLTLESLSSGSVSEPGSDLGRALRKVAEMMPPGRRDEQVVVIWTDGEDLEGGAGQGVDALVSSGVRVFAVGVGTPAGDVVPVLDDQGRAIDVKRDEGGGPVISRLDESALRTLGRRTRGGYFAASRPGGELPRLIAAVGGVGRSARGERLIERPVARFTWCGAIAALLIAAELRRPRRRRVEAEGVALHSGRTSVAAAALALVAIAGLSSPAAAQSDWARADAAFKAGRFAEAESLYARRMKTKAPPDVRVNRATALAQLGRAEEAEALLAPLTSSTGRAGSAARYNLGTSRGRRGDLEGGLGALREALERDPTDADARWNYEVLLRRQAEQQRPPQSGGGGQNTPQQGGDDRQGPDAQPDPQRGGPQPQDLPQAPQPQRTQPQTAPVQGQAMTREQADRILGALDQMARLDQQRQRRVRVVQERRGKDW
jgi:Ca-activated chloride channel family protein